MDGAPASHVHGAILSAASQQSLPEGTHIIVDVTGDIEGGEETVAYVSALGQQAVLGTGDLDDPETAQKLLRCSKRLLGGSTAW